MSRNFTDPRYAKWRKSILARDGNRCRFPGCGETSRLHVHHIKTWASAPHLRFASSNGVSLCISHHSHVTKREEQFEALFSGIVRELAMANSGKVSTADDVISLLIWAKLNGRADEE